MRPKLATSLDAKHITTRVIYRYRKKNKPGTVPSLLLLPFPRNRRRANLNCQRIG